MIDIDSIESEANRDDRRMPKSTFVRQQFRKYATVYSFVKS